MVTSPQATTSQSLDLRVFILVIAAIILVAGAVTGVQEITGDDTSSEEPVPTTEVETGAFAPGADGIE